jgi:cytochrome c peroxidase
VALVLVVTSACSRQPPRSPSLTATEDLGKRLFFDQRLSLNGNQSCATCHDPAVGWTGPLEHINRGGGAYEGSVLGLFSNRKPPSAAYATQAPIFRLDDPAAGDFVGGNFWDGRATGERLGNPAADQALAPFLNPIEQALPSAAAVVERVCGGPYGALFIEVWGKDICANVEQAFANVGRSIAEYEASVEVNAFSSKYDAFLAGRATLTDQETRGLRLFEGQAKCAECHPHRPGPDGSPPLFTDYTFDNLGLPRNPENPYYTQPANPLGHAWVDEGLGRALAADARYRQHAEANRGKHRVPTLRNVDLRPSPGFAKCYGHNCYFKDLETFVHFYNTRLILPVCSAPAARAAVDCWPAPEIDVNINTEELGDLRLSQEDERAIVAFLATLSDGYQPRD